MARKPTPHTALVNAVLAYLRLHGLPAFKNNVAAVRVAGRFFRCGQAGWPDIIAVAPGGLFLGLEVKTGTGRLTQAQKAVHKVLSNAGAILATIRSLDDLEDLRRKDWQP